MGMSVFLQRSLQQRVADLESASVTLTMQKSSAERDRRELEAEKACERWPHYGCGPDTMLQHVVGGLSIKLY